jgi:hypothetical protein
MKQLRKKPTTPAAIQSVTRDRLVDVTGGGGQSTITNNKDGIDVRSLIAKS